MENDFNVCVLYVLYEPKLDLLITSLGSIKDDVKRIYIYDNSNDTKTKTKIKDKYDNVIYFSSENIGIASAQNVLIQKSFSDGFNYALLSDQDTIYPNGYIHNLKDFLFRHGVIAVCPGWQIVDGNGRNITPGLSIIKNNKIVEYKGNDEVDLSHAISSGMIINLNKTISIGCMDERLFIDWVDNDFCWRAICAGYKVVAVPRVKILHELGDRTLSFFGRKYTMRNNIRDYYIIRNSLYILMYKDICNKAIKNYLIKKIIHHFIFSFIASDNKMKTMKLNFVAICHAVKSKMGKL